MRRLLRLPDPLRKKLAEPVGTIISGEDYFDVARRVSSLLLGKRSWCVGDVLVHSLVSIGFVPDVAIVDRKTVRNRFFDTGLVERVYREIGSIHALYNPPGHINLEFQDLVSEILREKRKRLIIVDGEEDLLSLAVIVFAPLGDVLAYGLPGVGVVVIEINDEMKMLAKEVFDKMIPVEE